METTLRVVKTVLDRTPGIQGYALIGGRRQDPLDVERLLAEAELDEKLLYRLARKAKVKKDLLRIAKRAGWRG